MRSLYAVSASLSKDNQGEFPYNTTMVPLWRVPETLISGAMLIFEVEGSDPQERVEDPVDARVGRDRSGAQLRLPGA